MKFNRQTPCVYKNIRVVFHGIPKNASTSVKNALYEYDNNRSFGNRKQWIHKGSGKGGSIYPDIECIKTKFDDWFHFTVVRNPYDRFVSFYSDLFAKTAYTRASIPSFYTYNEIKFEGMTVDLVIDMIEKFGDDDCDEHFASQLSFVYKDDCQILKMESLEKDWKEVCSKLSLDYKPLPLYNVSKASISLTESQKERIYKRYGQDFKQLGYDK